MAEYHDFQIVVQPNISSPGTWSVLLEACRVNALAGPKGNVEPKFTRDQLKELRNRNNWPNQNKLKDIGQSVAASLMTPDLKAALLANLAVSQPEGRGTRLVVSMVGEEPAPAADVVRLQELPVEALRVDDNFLALNPMSPLSRSLHFKADRDPVHVTLPLRVLVVVATPTGLPTAHMQDEKKVIEDAFDQLADPGGPFTLQFCDPPTKSKLVARLTEGFHILHFVGHGAYEIVGDDPSPRPHLVLEKNGEADPIDADTLDSLLSNTGIRLVVMTACSSAAPTPEEVEETVGPFCGVAQRLVAGVSGVNASVAMQLDLASDAAVEFSKTFYTHLLTSDRKLDEIISLCRKALSTSAGVGDRAWVTPVIYWSCKDGRVFDIEPMRGVFDEQTRMELGTLQREIDVNLDHIKSVQSQPPNIVSALAGLIAGWQQKVDDLMLLRGQKMGETLRLRGGKVAPGGAIACQLLLRLRTPAQVDNIGCRLIYPTDKVGFVARAAGTDVPGAPPFVDTQTPGELVVQFPNVSHGAQWTPGEYELATISFQVNPGVTDPVVLLKLADASVHKDGAGVAFNTLDGVVFVT